MVATGFDQADFSRDTLLVMIAARATFMRGCRGVVALETFFVRCLANFKSGRRFLTVRKIVFLALEIFPVLFVTECRCLIGYMPVIIDRFCMTLITSSRWGNCLPSREHGAARSERENRCAGKNTECFHDVSPEVGL